MPRIVTQLIFSDANPTVLAAVEPAQDGRQVAGARDPPEAVGLEAVDADRDAVQPRLAQRAGQVSSSMPLVVSDRSSMPSIAPEHRDEVDDAVPDGRLAAGQLEAADAVDLDGGADDVADLLEA